MLKPEEYGVYQNPNGTWRIMLKEGVNFTEYANVMPVPLDHDFESKEDAEKYLVPFVDKEKGNYILAEHKDGWVVLPTIWHKNVYAAALDFDWDVFPLFSDKDVAESYLHSLQMRDLRDSIIGLFEKTAINQFKEDPYRED